MPVPNLANLAELSRKVKQEGNQLFLTKKQAVPMKQRGKQQTLPVPPMKKRVEPEGAGQKRWG